VRQAFSEAVVEEGSDVKEGQVLFRDRFQCHWKPLLAARKRKMSKAEAALKESKARVARFGELVSSQRRRKQVYDEAVATLGQNEADFTGGKGGGANR